MPRLVNSRLLERPRIRPVVMLRRLVCKVRLIVLLSKFRVPN